VINSIRAILAAGLFVLGSIHPVSAGPLEEAKAAADRHDYAAKMRILQPLAEAGNPEAQEMLGRMYWTSQEGVKNDVLAAYWFRKAAEQDDTDAQHALGYIYKEGLGVAKNYVQAAFWYRKAAEDHDYEESQDALSELYRTGGYGLEPDFKQACFWSEVQGRRGGTLMTSDDDDDGKTLASAINATSLGNETARAKRAGLTATIMETGKGGPDRSEIRTVVTGKAPADAPSSAVTTTTSKGAVTVEINEGSTVIAASSLTEGCARVAAKLTQQQLDDIKAMVADWTLKHPISGLVIPGPIGRFRDAAVADWRGDYAKALSFFRAAADEGDSLAQINLGLMYQHGHGVPQDDVQAVAYYRKAADQGSEQGQVYLGQMYETGKGVNQDVVQAYFWYAVASEYPPAMTSGVWFLDGDGARARITDKMTDAQIKQAQESTLAFLYKQAEQENLKVSRRAKAKLRGWYAHGPGTERDLAQACFWDYLLNDPSGDKAFFCPSYKTSPSEFSRAKLLASEWLSKHR